MWSCVSDYFQKIYLLIAVVLFLFNNLSEHYFSKGLLNRSYKKLLKGSKALVFLFIAPWADVPFTLRLSFMDFLAQCFVQ